MSMNTFTLHKYRRLRKNPFMTSESDNTAYTINEITTRLSREYLQSAELFQYYTRLVYLNLSMYDDTVTLKNAELSEFSTSTPINPLAKCVSPLFEHSMPSPVSQASSDYANMFSDDSSPSITSSSSQNQAWVMQKTNS